MKVWEKCNEVKGTKATVDEIADWAYMNKICPLEFDFALEIDIPKDSSGVYCDTGFTRTARICCQFHKCGKDCLMAYLNGEYLEAEE